ncbi:MAG: phage tail protein [Anaerolineae bacterium]
MGGTGNWGEAHSAYRFVVQLDGNAEAAFTECTLPSLEVDVLEQKEGGYNTGVHLLPGPVKAGRVTLKAGVTRSSKLLQWYKDVANGKSQSAQRNVSVIMYDAEQQPVLRLSFTRAYPVKWSGPTFRTADSAIAIETLELAFAEVQME